MSKNIISSEDARLLIKKLMTESIPVLAFLISSEGPHIKLSGFVNGVSAREGLVVCGIQGKPTESSYLRVPLEQGCEFLFGDKREMEESVREPLAAKYGDSVLMFRFPSGSVLGLFFNSLTPEI